MKDRIGSAYIFNRFFALGLLRGALLAPGSPFSLRALFVPLAVALPFLPLPFSAAAGVEAASEALSKEDAWAPASPLVDDGGDEAS